MIEAADGHSDCSILFFQAEDGIRDLVRSRGLGDVYKRQIQGVGQKQKPQRSHHAQDQRPFRAAIHHHGKQKRQPGQKQIPDQKGEIQFARIHLSLIHI